jgi:hypothetical protein
MLNFNVKIKTLAMKSLLFFFLFAGATSSFFSQETFIVGRSQSVSELVQSKSSGVYTFYFPASISKEKIETAANYYPTYFTYSINEVENSIKITLLENTLNNRRIIMRFLMSSRLQKINVEDTELLVQDFFESYLN